MAATTYELVWFKQLLREIRFGEIDHMELVCYNLVALSFASNFVFRKRTKNVMIDCHFVKEEKIYSYVIL